MGNFSVLYIDNPVGAGYSYQEQETPNELISEYSYTEDLYTLIEQFYQMFPDSLNKKLYIGGQSYAGKYVTSLAYRIHVENVRGARLPLAGIYMGGPFFAPEIMIPSQIDYLYALGVVSRLQADKHRKVTKKFIKENRYMEKSTRAIVGHTFFQDLPSHDNYVTEEKTNYDAIEAIMTSERIRLAVGAGNQTFHAFNTELYDKFGFDFLESSTKKLSELLESGRYKVLIFNGDFDAVTTSGAIGDAVLALHWSGQDDYAKQSRHMWFWPPNLAKFQDKKLYGFFTKVTNLCRVIVHGAGHQVPRDQPDIALLMMNQFVQSGCVMDWPF